MSKVEELLESKREMTTMMLDEIINHSHTLYHYRDIKETDELMSEYRNMMFDYDGLDVFWSMIESTFEYNYQMLVDGIIELDTNRCQRIEWVGDISQIIENQFIPQMNDYLGVLYYLEYEMGMCFMLEELSLEVLNEIKISTDNKENVDTLMKYPITEGYYDGIEEKDNQ